VDAGHSQRIDKMNKIVQREAKVPVASQCVKAKASTFGGLDAKFGYQLMGLSWKQSNSMNNKIGSKL